MSQGSSLLQKNSSISINYSNNNSGKIDSKGNMLSSSKEKSSGKSSSEINRNDIKRMKMDSINESSNSPQDTTSFNVESSLNADKSQSN